MKDELGGKIMTEFSEIKNIQIKMMKMKKSKRNKKACHKTKTQI